MDQRMVYGQRNFETADTYGDSLVEKVQEWMALAGDVVLTEVCEEEYYIHISLNRPLPGVMRGGRTTTIGGVSFRAVAYGEFSNFRRVVFKVTSEEMSDRELERNFEQACRALAEMMS